MHSNKKKKEKEKKKVDITLSVISKALNVHMKYGENSLNWKRDNRELIASQNAYRRCYLFPSKILHSI